MRLFLLALAVLSRSQLPSVERLAAGLTSGRLVLDQVHFQLNADALQPEGDPVLRQAARAINTATGQFVVYVAPEREGGLPPDTVLARRRRAVAFRALLSAGANPARLLGLADGASPSPESIELVSRGGARIELVRVDRPAPPPHNHEESTP